MTGAVGKPTAKVVKALLPLNTPAGEYTAPTAEGTLLVVKFHVPLPNWPSLFCPIPNNVPFVCINIV